MEQKDDLKNSKNKKPSKIRTKSMIRKKKSHSKDFNKFKLKEEN